VFVVCCGSVGVWECVVWMEKREDSGKACVRECDRRMKKKHEQTRRQASIYKTAAKFLVPTRAEG